MLASLRRHKTTGDPIMTRLSLLSSRMEPSRHLKDTIPECTSRIDEKPELFMQPCIQSRSKVYGMTSNEAHECSLFTTSISLKLISCGTLLSLLQIKGRGLLENNWEGRQIAIKTSP